MHNAFQSYQYDKEFEAYLIAQQNSRKSVRASLEKSEKNYSEKIKKVLEEKEVD